MLRLGIDTWGLSGEGVYSGIGHYASLLLRHLPAFAPHIRITAYGGPGERRPPWLSPEVAWKPLGIPATGKFGALHSRLLLLPRRVQDDRLDLFHAPGVHTRPSLPPVPRLSCPVVTTLHDVIPITYYGLRGMPARMRLFYRWNLERALTGVAVITVSEQSAREIRASSTRPVPVTVIANPIDFKPEHERAALDVLGIRRPFILYAGSYEPRKNLVGALSAYAILAARGASHQLVAIVERHSGHAAVAVEQTRALQLEARVRFLHSLPDRQLRALYTQADLLLFPSYAEGFGFPPLQAAACGTPVVASDLEVLRSHLQDAAIYVDPADILAMSNAIDWVLRDRALRRRLRDAGPRRAGLFSVDACLRSHVALYDSVVRSPMLAVS